MADRGGGPSELSADQVARLRRARWRWTLKSVLWELALAAAIALSLVLTPWLVADPAPFIAMVVGMGVTMAVIVPMTHLSPRASHRSLARRNLVLVAAPQDVRRVSAHLRQRRIITGADLAIARARVVVAVEQRRAPTTVLGLLLLSALLASVVARADGHPVPWGLDGVLAVATTGLVWQTVSLSRLLAGAGDQGIVASKRR